MAKKQVEVRIKTTADTTGAKAVEKAMAGVEKSADRAGKALTDGDAKQAAKEFGQLADELQDVRKHTDALGSDAKAANKSLGQMERGARNVGRAVQKGAKSQRNFGLATLEASRAIEDMQYGVRGVLNNIPGLVMMLGGGAGLAGVISVAAVAAAQLAPLLLKMGKDGSSAAEELAAAEEFLADSVELSQKRIAEVKKQAAKESGDAVEAAATNERRLIEDVTAAMERQLQVMRRKQAAAMEDVDRGAAISMLEVDISDMSDLEKTRAKARIAEDAERRKIELQKQALRDELAQRKKAAAEAARAAEDVRRRLDIVAGLNESVNLAGVAQKGAIETLQAREDLAKGLTNKTRLSTFLDIATAGLNPFGDTDELVRRTGAARQGVTRGRAQVDMAQAATRRAFERRQAAGASPEEETDLRARLARLQAEAASLGLSVQQGTEDLAFADSRFDADLSFSRRRAVLESQATQNRGLGSIAAATGAPGLQGILSDGVANQNQSGQIIAALQQALGSKAAIDAGLLQMITDLIAEQQRIGAQVEALQAAARR